MNRAQPLISPPWMVFIGAVLWSTGGVGVKLLEDYGPTTVSSGRSLISAVVFLLLLGGRLLPKREALGLVAAGAVCYMLVVYGFVTATRFTTAANAIILQYTAPIWIAAWNAIRGMRPTGHEVLAMIAGLVGMVLCGWEGMRQGFADGAPATSGNSLLGDLIALGSGIAFAAVTVLLGALGRRAGDSEDGARAPLQMVFWGNALTFLSGAHLLFGDLPQAGIPGAAPWLGWLLLLWLGAGQLSGGYWFFQRGLRATPAITASLLCLIEPVLNPVWVAIFAKEIPPMTTQLGGLMVLAAVVITVKGSKDSP